MGYPLNLEALGVSGICVALLLYWNYLLRQESNLLKAEVKKERERTDEAWEAHRGLIGLYRDTALKIITTNQKLEMAFLMLKDGLK